MNRRDVADRAWNSLAVYTDKWNKELWDIKAIQSTSGGRLSVYRILKPNPGAESYVKEHLPMSVRRVVAGLRMGCLATSCGGDWEVHGNPL